MIVVISDLHFEEEASDIIYDQAGRPALIFRRNLHPKAYRSFIAAMADEVRRRKVRNFDLVIAGDLFDFSRTALWFEDELRPYVPLSAVSPALERKILKILEATAAEPPVHDAVACLRLLAQGRYRPWSDNPASPEELPFPAERIAVHCLSGNHDRVANATPAVRRRIRELLGLEGDGAFGHTLVFDDPAVLVRHGHEYDPDNFALDLTRAKTISSELPEEAYAEPVLGDFITIDIAVRLPHLLRRKYGDAAILQDPVLSNLYLRLLQFDDVRPQSALLDYVLDVGGGDFSEEQVWERMAPVLEILLDEIHGNRFFRSWLQKRNHPWTPMLLDVARGLLKLGFWRNRPARELARSVSRHLLGGDGARPELFARREQVIQSGTARLVLAGHTHVPQVSLLASEGTDRFYINTGTWRNRIPSTPDQRTFGRMKALTYVMLFTAEEDREGPNPEFGSFDYWTGYTRHWADGLQTVTG